MQTLVGGAVRPRSGDVVLASVERLGHHRRIEQPNGRRSALHLGDTVVVAYADRYATDQFESQVPRSLGRTQLVASGGIASQTLSQSRAVRRATDIVPLGLVGDDLGRPLNVWNFRLPEVDIPPERPRTIAVLGTSMNAGKTTTMHYLLHGLSKVGAEPGSVKVTGTGSGNDYWVMLDAGAHRVYDFTDAGLASTFRQPIPVLESAMTQLVAHLTVAGCGVNFVEIADGVFQQENRMLLTSPVVHDLLDVVVLAASDAMGAAHGVAHLRERGFEVAAVSGVLTRSPLAIRETQEATGLPVWGIPELQSPDLVMPTLGIDVSLARQPAPTPPAAWPIELEGLDAHRADVRVEDGSTAAAGAPAAAALTTLSDAELASSDSLRGGAHLVLAGRLTVDGQLPVHQTRASRRTIRAQSGPHTRPGLRSLFRVSRVVVALVVALGLAQGTCLLAFILLLSRVITALEPTGVGFAAERQYRDSLLGCALLAVLGMVLGVLRAIEFTVTEKAGYAVVRRLRMEMYAHLQRMLPEHLLHRARGGLLLRLTGDLSMLRMWLSRGQLQGTSAAITLVAGLTGAFVLDWPMACALLAVLCAGATVSVHSGRAMRRATRTMRRRRSLVIGSIAEQVNALAVIQVAGRTAGEFARLSRQNDSLNRALDQVAALRGRLRGLATASSMVATAAVVAVGVVEVRRGAVLPTTVLLEVLIARFLTRSVRTLGLMHDYWHRGLVSRHKILEFLASSSRSVEASLLPALRVRRGEIRFDGVTVPGALHELTAVVEPRTIVAITGGAGSGASTILELVARLVDPTAGTVTVDEQDLLATDPASIGRVVGMVGPDLPLLRGTVSRNLRYAAREASAEEVQRVVFGLGLHHTLGRLGGSGVGEWLVEGGHNISPADRQLIALGRALMGSPPILLLDRPLDGLDPVSRTLARAMLLRHRGTVLWCTEEPEDLAGADLIWVMEQGRLVDVLPSATYRAEQWTSRPHQESRWPAPTT
jgi:ATP-binding cassette subfamily B protein